MKAETGASQVLNWLGQRYTADKALSSPPDVAAIPLNPRLDAYGLMVNLCLASGPVGVTSLWEFTVLLVRSLSDLSLLRPFSCIEIRVFRDTGDRSYERIVSLFVRKECISELPITPLGMLDSTNPEAFRFHWYLDPTFLSGEMRSTPDT